MVGIDELTRKREEVLRMMAAAAGSWMFVWMMRDEADDTVAWQSQLKA